MSITITTKQIAALAEFAGLAIDHDKTGFSEDELETEFVLTEDMKVRGEPEHGIPDYEGLTVHLAEYPEEGYLPLAE